MASAGRPVWAQLDAQRSVLSQHGPAAGAIAMVDRVFRPGSAVPVAQVVRQIGTQGALDQRLLEYHRGGIDRLCSSDRLRTGQ